MGVLLQFIFKSPLIMSFIFINQASRQVFLYIYNSVIFSFPFSFFRPFYLSVFLSFRPSVFLSFCYTKSSLQKLNFCYQRTKPPKVLWTMKQEMEYDDDHATMRESFSLHLRSFQVIVGHLRSLCHDLSKLHRNIPPYSGTFSGSGQQPSTFGSVLTLTKFSVTNFSATNTIL